MKKRIVALFVAFLIILSAFIPSFADEAPETEQEAVITIDASIVTAIFAAAAAIGGAFGYWLVRKKK